MAGYSEYCWKRLTICASEDCFAEPNLPANLHGLYEGWKRLRAKDKDSGGSASLVLIHACILLCR